VLLLLLYFTLGIRCTIIVSNHDDCHCKRLTDIVNLMLRSLCVFFYVSFVVFLLVPVLFACATCHITWWI